MMRRFTSSPKPASRVRAMTSSALGAAVVADPQAVAHGVEPREVAGRLARQDQVVRGQRVVEVGQDTSTTSAPASTSSSTASWKRCSTPAW